MQANFPDGTPGTEYGLWGSAANDSSQFAGIVSQSSLDCEAKESCAHATYDCPSSNCQLECDAESACEELAFSVSDSLTSYHLECTGVKACKGANLNLTEATNVDSNPPPQPVLCSGESACEKAKIACPAGSHCTVQCDGPNACKDAVLTCRASSCDVVCPSDQDACPNLILLGNFTITTSSGSSSDSDSDSDSDSNGGYSPLACSSKGGCECTDAACNSICDLPGSCKNTTVLCMSDTCSLTCADTESCALSHVNCQTNGTCHLTCAGERSCYGLAPAHQTNYSGIAYPHFPMSLSGTEYGMWQSPASSPSASSTSRSYLNCYGRESCAHASVGCAAAAECAMYCSGEDACADVDYTVVSGGQVQHTTVHCSGPRACKDAKLTIGDAVAGFHDVAPQIRCEGEASCEAARVKCPSNAPCILHCQGRDACKDLQLTSTTCIVLCNPDVDSCAGLEIVGSCSFNNETYGSDSSASGSGSGSASDSDDSAGLSCSAQGGCECTDAVCHSSCNAPGSCKNTSVICASPQCSLDCRGMESCALSHVNCDSEGCYLSCSGERSCYGLAPAHQTNYSGITDPSFPEGTPGTEYGLWGPYLTCSGVESCAHASVGCSEGGQGMRFCRLDCLGESSCAELEYNVPNSALFPAGFLKVSCNATRACKDAKFTFGDVSDVGEVEVSADETSRYYELSMWPSLTCVGESACEMAKLACPDKANCDVQCEGTDACKDLELTCAEHCDVKCSNTSDSCSGLEVVGNFTLVYYTPDESDSASASESDSGIGSDSDSDSDSNGVDTSIPTTAAPTATPTSPPTSSPTTTEAPPTATPTSIPADPTTHSPLPSTPAPTLDDSVEEVVKEVFELVLGLSLAAFNRNRFVAFLQQLLGSVLTSFEIHWVCPASACTGGCPSSALAKLAAGCTAVDSAASVREAAVLQGDDGTVVLFEATEYAGTSTAEDVTQTINDEIANPSSASDEFQLRGVSTGTTGVLVAVTTPAPTVDGDDDLSSGMIALIVCLCVGGVVLVALVGLVVFKASTGTVASGTTEKTNEPV